MTNRTKYDVYLISSGAVLVSGISKTEARRLTRGKKRGAALAIRRSQVS